MHWKGHVTVACVIEHEGRFLLVEERAEGGGLVLNQPAGSAAKNWRPVRGVIAALWSCAA